MHIFALMVPNPFQDQRNVVFFLQVELANGSFASCFDDVVHTEGAWKSVKAKLSCKPSSARTNLNTKVGDF